MRRHRLTGHPSIKPSPVVSVPGRMQPFGMTQSILQRRGEPGTSWPQSPICSWGAWLSPASMWLGTLSQLLHPSGVHTFPTKAWIPPHRRRREGWSRTELGWSTYLSQRKEKINVIVKRRAVLSFVCEVSCTESFISHEISPSCSPTPAAQ